MSRSRARPRPGWQVAAADVPADGWDVAVVGGGPAGATAALHVAARGRRVLLLERAIYPRPKACGDLLIPDALAALRRAGLYERVAAEAFRPGEALVSSPSRIEWTIPGDYLVLPRERFDALLAEEAARRGAVVAHGQVQAVEVEDGSGAAILRVRGRTEPVRATHAILAAGADVSLLEPLGMLERAAPTAVALRAYVRPRDGRGDPLRSLLISFDREIVPGYAWAFPVPGGAYNVGVGVLHDAERPARHDLRALFDTFCRELPRLRGVVDDADGAPELRGARLRCGLDGAHPRGPGNVLAVGEQIGTTYPFTGEGIGKAMETGERAAAAVVRALERDDPGELDRYAEEVEEHLRPRYAGYLAAQRWLSRPWLNDLVARRARRNRFLRDAARDMVAETADPRVVFSWRGLLRSLVGQAG